MGDDQPDEEQQQRIYRKARQTIADLNGGREPTRFREWVRMAGRFDIRYHLIPRLTAPAFFYDENAEAGDLFLPAVRDRWQLHVWIMHEMIEFLYSREVCSAFNYPDGWGDHHAMARVVDAIHSERMFLRQN